MIEEGKPLFLQIAERIEDSIVDGSLAEEAQVPSTNELAAFYRINPATAAKGVAMLTDKGVIYKRRGIGMFVAPGARDQVLGERKAAFADTYVAPLIAEARKLGLTADDVTQLITERATQTSEPRSKDICWTPLSRSATSPRRIKTLPRSAASASTSSATRSTACSGATAPARPPPCRS